ncbi:hypothetical protein F5B18DRAFT_590929 [Nemania serpens]|nr:hypothetical protein F5B18DRAFT_590929 [Nemania serpens]
MWIILLLGAVFLDRLDPRQGIGKQRYSDQGTSRVRCFHSLSHEVEQGKLRGVRCPTPCYFSSDMSSHILRFLGSSVHKTRQPRSYPVRRPFAQTRFRRMARRKSHYADQRWRTFVDRMVAGKISPDFLPARQAAGKKKPLELVTVIDVRLTGPIF